MPDPFAARNLRSVAVDMEWPLTRNWMLHAALRRFSLATDQDGLYTTGEDFLVCKGTAASATIGSQVLVSADYQISARMQLHAGVARFLPGAYLTASDLRGRWTTPYVAWSYRF